MSFDRLASREYVSGLGRASLAKVISFVSPSVVPGETIPHHVLPVQSRPVDLGGPVPYVVPTGRVIATDSVIVATSGYVVPAAYDISPGRVK
ncbi:hypothetical protein Tco_1119223 [Tanacetum coccineum]